MDARREREVEGLEGARRGPAPGWLGVPLARVYGAVVGWRNARFDRGVGVTRVGVPVVSVGNVSVGGTGKTPMVMWLARRLMERGERPAIALRGYKGGRGGAGSDEATEFRRWLPEVPLAVGGDRVATIGALRGSAEGARVSCVLLDDGFQHRRLHRDLDVVLVDATRDPFADRLLPAGWLREPVEGLKRAGAVVLTRYDAGDAGHLSLRERLEQTHGGRVLTAAAQWGGLDEGEPVGATPAKPVAWLRGKRLLVVCGIGNPAAFLRQVKGEAGAGGVGVAGGVGAVVEALFYPDHYGYPARGVREVVNAARGMGAEAIVTTEKDWSKLGRLPAGTWPCAVVRPRLDLRVEPEGALMEMVVGAVEGARG